MRDYLAPLDLLHQELNTLAPLIDTRRRTCTELRTRLDRGPQFAQKYITAHDLAVAEEDLRGLERRYADTQTEFALSVTLGRTFDQVPNSPLRDATAAAQHLASAALRPFRPIVPSTPTGHDQATAAALRPGPTAHVRTAGASPGCRGRLAVQGPRATSRLYPPAGTGGLPRR